MLCAVFLRAPEGEGEGEDVTKDEGELETARSISETLSTALRATVDQNQ